MSLPIVPQVETLQPVIRDIAAMNRDIGITGIRFSPATSTQPGGGSSSGEGSFAGSKDYNEPTKEGLLIFGFESIKNLAHAMESVLMQVRDGYGI